MTCNNDLVTMWGKNDLKFDYLNLSNENDT